MLACPNRSETTFGFSPADKRRVAQECLKSYSLKLCASFALVSTGRKCRLESFPIGPAKRTGALGASSEPQPC